MQSIVTNSNESKKYSRSTIEMNIEFKDGIIIPVKVYSYAQMAQILELTMSNEKAKPVIPIKTVAEPVKKKMTSAKKRAEKKPKTKTAEPPAIRVIDYCAEHFKEANGRDYANLKELSIYMGFPHSANLSVMKSACNPRITRSLIERTEKSVGVPPGTIANLLKADEIKEY